MILREYIISTRSLETKVWASNPRSALRKALCLKETKNHPILIKTDGDGDIVTVFKSKRSNLTYTVRKTHNEKEVKHAKGAQNMEHH